MLNNATHRSTETCRVLKYDRTAHNFRQLSLPCNTIHKSGLSDWTWLPTELGKENATLEPDPNSTVHFGIPGNPNYGAVVKTQLQNPRKNKRLWITVQKHNAIHYDETTAVENFRALYLLRKLRHPNISNLLYIYSETGEPSEFANYYLVLDYDGKTLAKCLSETTLFSLHQIRSIAAQLFCGLTYLHEHAVPHGALNPDCINISLNFLVKITNLGKYPGLQGDQTEDAVDRSTPYRPIELVINCVEFESFRAACAMDLWSIGIIVVELLTGKLPTNQPNDLMMVEAVVGMVGRPDEEFLERLDPLSRTFFEKGGQSGTVNTLTRSVRREILDECNVDWDSNTSKLISKCEINNVSDVSKMRSKLEILKKLITIACDDCLVINPQKRSSAKDVLGNKIFVDYFRDSMDKRQERLGARNRYIEHVEVLKKRGVKKSPRDLDFYGINVKERCGDMDEDLVLERWRLRIFALVTSAAGFDEKSSFQQAVGDGDPIGSLTDSFMPEAMDCDDDHSYELDFDSS